MSVHEDMFYVVDGHAQFFRAYFAIRSGMTSPVTNEPTQMAFGYIGMLLRLLRDLRPKYLVLVIDAAGDQETFRSQIYPQYKAHRDPAPIDFHGQVERCLEFTRLIGIPVFGIEGVEADDVIATIARRVRQDHPGLRMRIVSKDKDLAQLVDPHTTLYDPQTGVDLGPEQLFETKGVRADQVADMLALMGDTADNIPGIAGIGPKTAAQLITTYGNLDALLGKLDELTPKRREAIKAGEKTLSLARQLVALKEDCDIDLSYESARVDLSRANSSAALELMRTLGFGRLRGEVEELLGARPSQGSQPVQGAQAPSAAPTPRKAPSKLTRPPSEDPGLFAYASGSDAQGVKPAQGELVDRAHPAFHANYSSVQSRDRLLEVMAQAREASRGGRRISFDTETTSLNIVDARLCGVSLSWEEGQGVYVPLRSPVQSMHLSCEEALPILRELLEDSTVPKCAHNAKFDLQVLRRHGVAVKGLAGDSMVASYVLDSARVSHSLDALSQAILGYTCIPIRQLIGSGDFQRTFDQVDLALAVPYAAEDADIAGRLDRLLASRVHEQGLDALYRDLELPLVEVLADLEYNGILVDAAELDRQCAKLSAAADEYRAQIAAMAPHEFNPDSPRQLAAVLFNSPEALPPGLGLKSGKRVSGGLSTGIEVLEKLAADPSVQSELPARMIEYRKLKKLVGTYLVALRGAIQPSTGRIHASFHQTGTATGRLSSSDPNMQNIPIRTEVGREVRRAFIAPPGHQLLACDYSQIELRVLAHLSGDPAMIAAFHGDIDIHTAVAAEVAGIDPRDVTPQQRDGAKMVNFGIIYGITPYGLARRLGGGTTPARAKEIIDGYRSRFARIDGFLAKCVALAHKQGFVSTLLGRRRAIPQVASSNHAERALGERIAINTVVQGTAADLIKVAMVNLHRHLASEFPQVKMLLQIHDELLFEIPDSQLMPAQERIVQLMESAMDLAVPLRVHASHGNNWFDAS